MDRLNNDQLRRVAAQWQRKADNHERVLVQPSELDKLANVVLRLLDEIEGVNGVLRDANTKN